MYFTAPRWALSYISRLMLGEEPVDHRCELGRLGQQGEVPAGVDVRPRVGDPAAHDPRVDRRDERVVVAGDDQRRLSDQSERRQAAPARTGQQLVVVAAAGP